MNEEIKTVQGQLDDILRYINQDNLNGWKTQDEQLQEWLDLLYPYTDSGNINTVFEQIEDVLRSITRSNSDHWKISEEQLYEWRELLANT